LNAKKIFIQGFTAGTFEKYALPVFVPENIVCHSKLQFNPVTYLIDKNKKAKDKKDKPPVIGLFFFGNRYAFQNGDLLHGIVFRRYFGIFENGGQEKQIG
jgi:hypothetical protein